jgi:hypothetical protein
LLFRRRRYTITTMTVMTVTRMTATAIPALAPTEPALFVRAIALALHLADISSRSSSLRQHVRLTQPQTHGVVVAVTEIVGDTEAVRDRVSLREGVVVGGSEAPTLLDALTDRDIDLVGDIVEDGDSDEPVLMEDEGVTVSELVTEGVTEAEGVTGM